MATKVLIVDDSHTVRQQVGGVLGQAGYEIVEAADGHEALVAMGRHRDVALVICDVNMPGMNGIDLLLLLKREPKNAALSVIMLTTEGQPSLIKRAKEAGARGWLVKPFKPDQLVATVRKLAGAA
jgi:two-component system chemotaxis response regulator CheY